MKSITVVRALAAACTAALALALAACGSSSSSGSTAPGSAPPGSPAAAQPAAQPTGGNGKTLLGIVSISPAEANNARFIKGAQAAANALGWSTVVIDAHGSPDEANSGISNLVQRKAGAIVDMVFPTSSLGSGLAAARQAGIPVATWGGGLGGGAVAQTGAGGPLATVTLTKMFKDMGGKGSVLALTYHAGQVCREREQVFDQMVKQYPQIKVTKQEVHIPGYLQDGANYASSWLGQHPKGSGALSVWGCWDDPALGALSAVRQQSRSDVKLYGQNGNAAAITAVNKGQMQATAWEDSVNEGSQLVKALAAAKKAGSTWKAKNVDVPSVLVTPANVKDFLAKHPDATRG
jgi:ribose transport system substrate-binding protein